MFIQYLSKQGFPHPVDIVNNIPKLWRRVPYLQTSLKASRSLRWVSSSFSLCIPQGSPTYYKQDCNQSLHLLSHLRPILTPGRHKEHFVFDCLFLIFTLFFLFPLIQYLVFVSYLACITCIIGTYTQYISFGSNTSIAFYSCLFSLWQHQVFFPLFFLLNFCFFLVVLHLLLHIVITFSSSSPCYPFFLTVSSALPRVLSVAPYFVLLFSHVA